MHITQINILLGKGIYGKMLEYSRQLYSQWMKAGNTHCLSLTESIICSIEYWATVDKNELLIPAMWINLTEHYWVSKARHKSTHTMWYHLRQVLEQAKRIQDGSQKGGDLGRDRGGDCAGIHWEGRDRNIQYCVRWWHRWINLSKLYS